MARGRLTARRVFAAALLLGGLACARAPITLGDLRSRPRAEAGPQLERLSREDVLDDLATVLAALDHGSVTDSLRPVALRRLEGALVEGPVLAEDRISFCAAVGDALAEGMALPLFATLDGTELCRRAGRGTSAEGPRTGRRLPAPTWPPWSRGRSPCAGSRSGEVMVPVLAIASFDPARDWTGFERFLHRASTEKALGLTCAGPPGWT